MKKRQSLSERKALLQLKEFKKKKVINESTKKMKDKQKDVHKEINNLYDLRQDKLRHNALTNNHLSHYIANLNFRLYSISDNNKSLKDDELKLIKKYTKIMLLLDKFQKLKAEILLKDKKELEDTMMELSLKEEKNELLSLYHQEKYEKFIYDKLILARDDLFDICDKYRTQVHLCEKYEANSLKLKCELDLRMDTNKKLINILERLRKIEKELKIKLKKKENKNIKIFEPIYSAIQDNISNKIIKKDVNKTINIKEENFYKININRPKSSFRLNKNKSCLILDKQNTFVYNKKDKNNKLKLTTNNFIKLSKSPTNSTLNYQKFNPNKSKNIHRTFSRKISLREKSNKQRSSSNYSTNYLTRTRNKSMVEITYQKNKNNEDIYDKNYLEIISQFLADNINKIREEIKLKMKYKAEELRSRYQLKYLISNIIEDIQTDIEKMKKEKDFDLNNYYDNLFGLEQNKEIKQLDKILFERKVEACGQQLYILSYILNNCFNGTHFVKSIFPKEMLNYTKAKE